MKEVRCKCGRLLAVVYDNGIIECKTVRQVIRTERALLSCLKCGRDIEVGEGGAEPSDGDLYTMGVDKMERLV